MAQAAGAIVVRQEPNQGKGTALQRGFRYALEEGFDAVLTLDADGQHDPAEMPLFIDTFAATFPETAPDLIIGRRRFGRCRGCAVWPTRQGELFFSWAVGAYIRDNQSGYRLLSRRMMDALLNSQEPGFEFEMEQIVVCLERGYRLAWVPIRTIYAGETSHIQPLQHVRNFVKLSLNTRKRLRRK
ncbi:MAG: glycosyltransferase family 2 protein [Caldilineaceae bacterium]